MTFRLHDSLSRSVRQFVPGESGPAPFVGTVRMYNCGPTVYSKVHIGNWRTNVCWDVLRRALELGGYKVRQVMNITDVGHLTVDDVADAAGEDKMELAARREQLDAWGIAKKYTDYFHACRKRLNVLDAETYPKATDHIPEMIAHVEHLVRTGHAYVTPAGNVYFSVASFPEYGKLSGNTVEELDAGARIEVLDEKRDPADFALWKRDEKHQMQWDAPASWGGGRGFPGWHIECSAMSRKYLGDTLDIHTGGEDNAFPHHECEIAQSESLTGVPFSRFWLHTRFLLVDGQKMSKSKGTMFVLEDVEARGHSARVLRYYLLSTHYRAPMNFTWDALAGAEETVKSLDAMVRRLHDRADVPDQREVAVECDSIDRDFLGALEDDLNVSVALSVVFRLRSFVNKAAPFNDQDFQRVRRTLRRIDSVLGLGLDQPATFNASITEGVVAGDSVSVGIQALVDERDAAKKSRDFARADVIRKDLAARGIVIEDTKQGTKWRRG